jgi:hypothetical protein
MIRADGLEVRRTVMPRVRENASQGSDALDFDGSAVSPGSSPGSDTASCGCSSKKLVPTYGR